MFIHEVGIGEAIFVVSVVCGGVPGFLAGMLGGGKECM